MTKWSPSQICREAPWHSRQALCATETTGSRVSEWVEEDGRGEETGRESWKTLKLQSITISPAPKDMIYRLSPTSIQRLGALSGKERWCLLPQPPTPHRHHHAPPLRASPAALEIYSHLLTDWLLPPTSFWKGIPWWTLSSGYWHVIFMFHVHFHIFTHIPQFHTSLVSIFTFFSGSSRPTTSFSTAHKSI